MGERRGKIRHSDESRNPEEKGGGAVPFACVRRRERAKRCSQGMPYQPKTHEHPPNPLAFHEGGRFLAPLGMTWASEGCNGAEDVVKPLCIPPLEKGEGAAPNPPCVP